VKLKGLGAIDRRSTGARELMAFHAQLVADKGGAEAISAAEAKLIDYAVRLSMYADVLDRWLLQQVGGLVNRRNKSVWPALRERVALGDSLCRVLVQLGLERRQRQAPSLSQYLAQRAAPDARTAPSVAQGTSDTPLAPCVASSVTEAGIVDGGTDAETKAKEWSPRDAEAPDTSAPPAGPEPEDGR